MPLIIVLVECGLEIIPNQIRNHPAVKKNSNTKNYSSQLLDNALHHSAMKNLKNFDKRGRPDIAHLCLLNALGSSVNKQGNLNLYLHTTKNRIFKFNPEIQVSRNYNRFKGLMAKLLIDGEITDNGNLLITEYNGTLKALINSYNSPEVILFSHKGKQVESFTSIFQKDLKKNSIAIIGGFQKGTFSKENLELSNNIITLSEFHLDAWVALYKIIIYYEIIHNIV